MAGLYQEGQRFPMYEEGRRFPTGDVPPPTMADYLRMLETRKRLSTMSGEMPSGLESAMPPSTDETIWRGKGLYGEQAFTNIPERAQAMGLRETMPPVSEGGYIESLPPSDRVPKGRSFSVEAPQAQVGGQGRSYAEKIKARQKLEAHILENGIPMAEAMKLQEFWGVDNDSLEKAQKAEGQTQKITSNVSANGFYLFNDGTESTIKAGAKPGRETLTHIDDDKVDSIAKGVMDGTINPDTISKRGNLQMNVFGRVKEIDPSFNLVGAGATAKFRQSSATMNTEALLNTIDPLLDELGKAGTILGNSDLPGYNRVANYLKEQTGSADIVGFNNLRDDVMAEIERGLLGTGVLSDSKYLRAVNNLKSSQSPSQLKAAIDNTRIVIKARLEALAKGPGQRPTATAGGGTTITVKNPTTGEMETWDTITEQRVK